MSTKSLTVTATSIVTSIRIDPVGQQVYLEGIIRLVAPGGATADVPVAVENVTASMTQQDRDAAVLLATRAQAWIDAKLP